MVTSWYPVLNEDTVRKQAKRYLVAAYGENFVFRAPETFSNIVERWIWSIASGSEDTLGEKCISEIEQYHKHRGSVA